MLAVQKAASIRGGRRGGCGAGRNGNVRKGRGGKQNREEHPVSEPLGMDPEIRNDEESEEKPKSAEVEQNVKNKGKRNQTARRGKPFSSKSGTHKISTKPCSVDLERKDIEKGSASNKKNGKNGDKGNTKDNLELEDKNEGKKKKVATQTNKKGGGVPENRQEDDIRMNINNVQGEVVVKTDNVIHDAKAKEDPRQEGLHMETIAAYVNDEEIDQDVAYTRETETDTEKRERLGIIGDSLEISKLENEIDEELIKKIKVSDTEERIRRLKEVLALLKGHRMSSDIKDDNTTENEQKSEEKKENEEDRKDKKEEKDCVKLDTKEQEAEDKNSSEYVNPDLQPKIDGKCENAKEDVDDEKKKDENSKSDENGDNAKQDVVDDKKNEQNSREKNENEVDRKDNDDVKLATKQEQDDAQKGSEYVNQEFEPKSDGKGEERKEDVVEENKNEGKSETDDIKLEEVVQSEDISKKDDEKDKSEDLKSDNEGSEGNKQDEIHLEERSEIEGINDENINKCDDGEGNIQKESSISESLNEIFVNTEKTSEEIEDIKKHVRFDLEPEDMDMEQIKPNGSQFSIEIKVGEIVNKLFVVQDSDKKKEEQIDDDYINFPSSPG